MTLPLAVPMIVPLTVQMTAPLTGIAPPDALPPAFVQQLRSLLGERFSTAAAICAQHGRDESAYAPMPPHAVAFANSTDEVAHIVAACASFQVPVIAFGAGTSLEGHVLALHGGIALDLSGMQQIVALHAEDQTVTLQAGVTRKQLNAAIGDQGLFFPVDPGADASLGGMAATRASGTNAVRYGTMRENTLALTVVTAAGQVIRTGTRARKSAAGYDLTRLFVGSEGTLGIITELTLRLHPLPEAVSAAVCSFADTADAVQAVIQIIQCSVPVARVEFLDQNGVRAINAYANLQLPEQALLLFEFHGSALGVAEQAATVQQIVDQHGATGFEWATKPEDRSRLWAARHNAYFALLQMRPGARAISTDCCVPISRLAECIAATKADCEREAMVYSIIGHVGDGNFHVLLLIDPDDAADVARAEAINARMVTRALAMDGTCTGEHGVGLHKMDFLIEEHGAEAIATMRAIKQALDPQNILNPGKVIRWDAG